MEVTYLIWCSVAYAKSLQLCLTLCHAMDCSPPGFSVRGSLQVRLLEWVAISSSRGSSQPRDRTCISYVSCIGGQVLYHLHHLGNPYFVVQLSSVAQLCLTLCNPMDCSTSGLPVHHQLLQFTQTHVPRVHDAIQTSHPLLSPSPPAPNPSQHQGLFK